MSEHGNPLKVYEESLRTFDRLVHRIRDDQWDASTPCTEWSVRDVVNHLVSEALWVPHVLAGQTMAAVGDRYDGDVLGDDPVGAWERASAAAHAAWTVPGATTWTVHLSFGETPAVHYCWQMACDLALHAWDVASGIGAAQPIPEPVAEVLVNVTASRLRSVQGSAIIGPGVPVPDDAPAVDRLLGFAGRDPRDGVRPAQESSPATRSHTT
ncbi:TIGR03086 family metal-binding protein [Lentzea sp. HUAS12]|uniref:TIGR03086 family metal-binding protein n=1 Tax=Lentzea sp. HUAS12 TaxID=2951806 RepID=UPI0020A23303|nr:TIGR03086 family metal-binding protein [Lentzea sp. HUAS12]USX52842.1 TIGR03086 family metal-binding protein [Lentzea sp. HUAS12]